MCPVVYNLFFIHVQVEWTIQNNTCSRVLRYAFIMLHITEADLKNNTTSLIFSLITNLRNCISLHNPYEYAYVHISREHRYVFCNEITVPICIIYIGLHG